MEKYNYTQRELSISCASHETSQMHLDTVQAMQKKIGIEEHLLQCGPHLPSDAKKLREVIQQNISPTSNFNNCSGKHTSMLAYAKMRGLPLENYLALDHPIQQEILKTLAEMCGRLLAAAANRDQLAVLEVQYTVGKCLCDIPRGEDAPFESHSY